jgi:hypothetical protein
MPMKAVIILYLLIFSSITISGCSQTPVPVSYPYSTQKQMQAARHWEIVAQDLTNDMLKLIPGEEQEGLRIYVPLVDASSFSQAMRSFLVTEMTRSGITVASNPEDGIPLYWSVQSVTHNASRSFKRLPPGIGLAAGALGYGVYKLWTDSTEFAKSLVLGATGEFLVQEEDIFHSFGSLPRNEIIVNVTLRKDNEIHYRLTNTYYIQDLDKNHYHFTRDLYHTDVNIETKTFNVKSRE